MRSRSSTLPISVILLLGCGRIDFTAVVDARHDRELAPGDTGAPPGCEPAWMTSPTLSTPQAVTSVSSPSFETGSFLSSDGLTLYFGSDRGGAGFDAYMAQRPSLGEAFGVPMMVAGANTSANDHGITLSVDGLEGFLSSDRAGADFDVFRATRPTTTDPFGTFAPVVEINGPTNDYNPVLSGDGLRLYFASESRAGGSGGTDLLVATRATTAAPFDPPVFMTDLDTAAAEASPTLIASERVIVFTSNRVGTNGTLDVWYATRASRDVAFDTPRPVPTISSPNKEWHPFLRRDGCELFFTYYDGSSSIEDIYVSEITP